MAKLKDKIKTVLDEGRMLILGSQVLLGLQFRSAFEKSFEKLPKEAQYLKLGSLILMTIAILLLTWPGAYHQIVEEGEDSEELHRFATVVITLALLPFALGLGIDFFVAVEQQLGRTPGIIAGVTATLVALLFWYGIEAIRRPQRTPRIKEKQAMEKNKEKSGENGGTKLEDKIEQVLTEIRVVLPGAQALLGFQFISTLMESFEKLPQSSKYVHLVSLAMIALSVIFMMTPAAYHRLVERGEDTEHMHRLASRMLILAMIPLALGISGDLFVVIRKVTESATAALIVSIVALVLFYGLWFGFTMYRRTKRQPTAKLETAYTSRQSGD